jgi:hypothetical protein
MEKVRCIEILLPAMPIIPVRFDIKLGANYCDEIFGNIVDCFVTA